MEGNQETVAQPAEQEIGAAGYAEDDVRFLDYVRLTKENLAASYVDCYMEEGCEKFVRLLGIGQKVARTIYVLQVMQLAAAHNAACAPKETAAFLRRLADEVENNREFSRVGHTKDVEVAKDYQDALLAVRYGIQRFHEGRDAQQRSALADVLAGLGIQQEPAPAETVQ